MAWWWAASAVLFLVVIPAVVVLGHRVVRQELLVKRYLDRIAGTVGNIVERDGLHQLDTTRQQALCLRQATAEYAEASRPPAPAGASRHVTRPEWLRGSE